MRTGVHFLLDAQTHSNSPSSLVSYLHSLRTNVLRNFAPLLRQSTDAELPHLLQCTFDLSIQCAIGILLSHTFCKEPLHTTKLLVAFLCELGLHLDHGLEARIEVWNAQVDELGQFLEQLLVERLEEQLRILQLLFGARELRWVVGWLVNEFVVPRAGCVVVEELELGKRETSPLEMSVATK